MRKVARVGLDGSVRTVAEGLSGASLDRPYTGGSFSVARDGAIAAPAAAPSARPTSRWCRSGAKRTFTRLNAELLDGKRLGEVRHLTATSFDGRRDRRLADPAAQLAPTGSACR